MSVSITNANSPKTVTGVDTYVFTASQTTFHTAKFRATIPAGSGLSVVIKQNTTTLATSVAPTPNQQEVDLMAENIDVTTGDTISFVLTSSTGVDHLPNVIQAQLILKIGPAQ